MSYDTKTESDEPREPLPERRQDADDGWADRVAEAPRSPMDRWEAAEDRIMAENIIANRQQQEILRGQGNDAAADAMEESLQKLPVSDEIKADPQGYLDGATDNKNAAGPGDELELFTPMERSQISANRKMAEDIITSRNHQAILRGQGEFAAAEGIEAFNDRLPLSDAIKQNPEKYLDLPPAVDLPPLADRLASGDTALLFQYHPEGPNMNEAWKTSEDPDAIRSSKCWVPMESLFAPEGAPSDSTWGELCDRLELGDEVTALFPSDRPVKTWEQLSQELALPEAWGFRSQLTIAEVPADRMPEPNPVKKQSARSRTWEGQVIDQDTPGTGTEVVFTGEFKDSWKLMTAEIPERAAELLSAGDRDSLDGSMRIAHLIGNHELEPEGDELKDQRYRPGGLVPAPETLDDGSVVVGGRPGDTYVSGSSSTESLPDYESTESRKRDDGSVQERRIPKRPPHWARSITRR